MSAEIPEDLKRMLGPNEQILLYMKEKFYHPKINIDSIIITNERVILRHPHDLTVRKDYTDYNYNYFSNVVLDKGLLRSTLKLETKSGEDPIVANDVPNDVAEKAYGIIRENIVRYQDPFAMRNVGVQPTFQQPQQSAQACPKCGAPVPYGQKFCGSCGSPL